MKIFAVIGNPIEQSKSPVIHQAFAGQAGEVIEYTKKLVPVDGFNTAADDFFKNEGKGLNITAPFKYNAFQYADILTERAELAEAVNTLSRQGDGRILGDNTDSVGLLNDVQDRLSWPVKHKRLLFLGAGGAVRGVLFPFLSAKPEALVIANRTASKAEDLERKFSTYGPITGIGLDKLDSQKAFDIIINASSAGLNKADAQTLPKACYHENTCFYDMSYSNDLTPFLQWVVAATGCKKSNYSDGLGMLVGQAAESYFVWTGSKPSVEPVMSLLQSF